MNQISVPAQPKTPMIPSPQLPSFGAIPSRPLIQTSSPSLPELQALFPWHESFSSDLSLSDSVLQALLCSLRSGDVSLSSHHRSLLRRLLCFRQTLSFAQKQRALGLSPLQISLPLSECTQDFQANTLFFPSLSLDLSITKCLRKVSSPSEARAIFLAVDKASQKKFVVKQVRKTSSPGLNASLRREFQAQHLLSLSSLPFFNPLVAFSESSSQLLAVSPFCEHGDLLDKALQEGPFSAEKCCALLRPVFQALCMSHSLGIFHRDVSLENIALAEEGPQVIDWGQCAEGEEGDGRVVGKKRYMSEEMHSGGECDLAKNDAFALGVCLFALRTGQMPFNEHGDERSGLLRIGVDVLLERMGLAVEDDVLELMRGLLRMQETQRMGVREALSSRFFRRQEEE